MSKPKLLTGPECADLLHRLAPDWPLLLYDGAVIDHILKVINNARGPYRSQRSNPPRLRSRQPSSGAVEITASRPI